MINIILFIICVVSRKSYTTNAMFKIADLIYDPLRLCTRFLFTSQINWTVQIVDSFFEEIMTRQSNLHSLSPSIQTKVDDTLWHAKIIYHVLTFSDECICLPKTTSKMREWHVHIRRRQSLQLANKDYNLVNSFEEEKVP